MTSVLTALRRGEGPFWGPLKRFARGVLQFHIPVGKRTRPAFAALYHLHVGCREVGGWAARFFWNEPLFRSQCAAVGPQFRMEQLPYIQGRGRIVIGKDVRLSGKSTIIFSALRPAEPELLIGDGTFVGHDCAFNVAHSVRVGARSLLAGGVQVYDVDGHPMDADRRRAGDPPDPSQIRPVVIGDDVWIGTRALVLKGVSIGDRSVVAARAVVTRDVPADVVVAGNPARIVKHLGRPGGLSHHAVLPARHPGIEPHVAAVHA